MIGHLTKNNMENSATHLSKQIFGNSIRLVLLSSILTSMTVLAETSFEPLERAMNKEERIRSGVDSLTSEQRAFLNNWLKARYGVMNVETPLNDRETPLPASHNVTQTKGNSSIEAEVERRMAEELATRKQAATDGPFQATVVGNFTGWRGKTVFRLDNGQIWRQRSSSNYLHRGNDQRVKFDKNWMGGWEMTVVSSGKSVLVTKVK